MSIKEYLEKNKLDKVNLKEQIIKTVATGLTVATLATGMTACEKPDQPVVDDTTIDITTQEPAESTPVEDTTIPEETTTEQEETTTEGVETTELNETSNEFNEEFDDFNYYAELVKKLTKRKPNFSTGIEYLTFQEIESAGKFSVLAYNKTDQFPYSFLITQNDFIKMQTILGDNIHKVEAGDSFIYLLVIEESMNDEFLKLLNKALKGTLINKEDIMQP